MNTISLNRPIPYPVQQVSFAGDKDISYTNMLLYLYIMFHCASEVYTLPNYPFINNSNPTITKQIGWPENTQVFASQSQRYYSCFNSPEDRKKHNIDISGHYSLKLIDKLKNGGIKSIYEAHKLLEKEGVKGGLSIGSNSIRLKIPQYPQATPGKVDAWNIEDKTKNRIIFAIGGMEKGFKRDIKNFCNEISQLYSIPEENIIKIPYADKETFEEGLKKLSEKIQESDPQNTELLIYYSGHGNVDISSLPFAKYFYDEGELIGKVESDFNEKDLKNFTKNKLKDIKTVIIMDTCHSGAWIADKAPPKRKDNLKSPHPNNYMVQHNLKPKRNPDATFHRARSHA